MIQSPDVSRFEISVDSDQLVYFILSSEINTYQKTNKSDINHK